MNIDRRRFLRASVPALVGAAVGVHELLVPSRTIFLPPKGGWLSGSWITRVNANAEYWALIQSEIAIACGIPQHLLFGVMRKPGEMDAEFRDRVLGAAASGRGFEVLERDLKRSGQQLLPEVHQWTLL